MFPPQTTYDEAARFLLRQGGGPMLSWLLDEPPDELRFRLWLDSVLTWPGTKERLCDAVARLEASDGQPMALLAEVQTRPDPSMFGRLCVAGGILWETVRPNDLTGDRYGLMALVVNLTGTGDSGRSFRRASSVWEQSPCEWNLEAEDADSIFAQVEAGTAPLEALAFVPLMKKGGDGGIIRRWLEIVGGEQDRRRRGGLTLAVVFAGLTGCADAWRKALEGFDVIESAIVNEWKAAARSEGERLGYQKGEYNAKMETLLRLLERKFGRLPDDLGRAIRTCDDTAKIDLCLDSILSAASLDDFRRITGL